LSAVERGDGVNDDINLSASKERYGNAVLYRADAGAVHTVRSPGARLRVNCDRFGADQRPRFCAERTGKKQSYYCHGCYRRAD
jgi:hypothetical protein